MNKQSIHSLKIRINKNLVKQKFTYADYSESLLQHIPFQENSQNLKLDESSINASQSTIESEVGNYDLQLKLKSRDQKLISGKCTCTIFGTSSKFRDRHAKL